MSPFGFATTDYPASSPWVTAVSGTSLGIAADKTGAIEPLGYEQLQLRQDHARLHSYRMAVWLGRRVSRIFPPPAYQSALGLTGRGAPDVAVLGDPQTGLLTGWAQTFHNGIYYDEYRIGVRASRARFSHHVAAGPNGRARARLRKPFVLRKAPDVLRRVFAEERGHASRLGEQRRRLGGNGGSLVHLR